MVKTVKWASLTRCLSLHNSFNSVYSEYLGIMKVLEKNDDATDKIVFRKINEVDFVSKLYLFKYAFPHLSAPRKTFQNWSN